jgi:outer membrane murein-binding lipoprotein Lpp
MLYNILAISSYLYKRITYAMIRRHSNPFTGMNVIPLQLHFFQGACMKRTVVAIAAAAIILTVLSGCGAKERDELRTKVATLEQQLTKANSDLAAKETELTAARGSLQAAQGAQAQAQAQLNSLSAELTRTKAELDKARAAAVAAKKKKK